MTPNCEGRPPCARLPRLYHNTLLILSNLYVDDLFYRAMICLFSRESRIQIEVILLATSFHSSLALPIAHSDACIPTTRLTGARKHPRHYGRCDRDCKGSSGICWEELLKPTEVVTNWTSSVHVSYPRMTADLLESQGDMYRTKTGGFLIAGKQP